MKLHPYAMLWCQAKRLHVHDEVRVFVVAALDDGILFFYYLIIMDDVVVW